jgi:hypothetical protein
MVGVPIRTVIGRPTLAGLLATLGIIFGFALFSLGCAGGSGDATPTSDPLAQMDAAARGLDWGNIAFDAPNAMRYGQVQTVELVLSPTLTASALQSQLNEQVGTESAQVQISNRMEAKLTGIGFTIEALSPDLQAVTTQQVTRWQWEVTPTGRGQKKLHLSLSALIGTGGSDAPLVVRTFDRDINVNVTIGQRVTGFLRTNWTWLWAAIVVPVAGYTWARWKKRSAPSTPQAPSPPSETTTS